MALSSHLFFFFFFHNIAGLYCQGTRNISSHMLGGLRSEILAAFSAADQVNQTKEGAGRSPQS